jgi:uncharacterized damage-inducible protein DinB
MEIKTMNGFLHYYEKTRMVTQQVLQVIQPAYLDWTYRSGKFTLADLVRHIAAIERYVFAEVVQGQKPCYKGCGKELADGYENIMAYFNEMHRQTLEIFKSIPDEALTSKIQSLDGRQIEIGQYLRALIVHEVHHRGALCIYLNLLGLTTPPVIGLREEEVIQRCKI